MSSQLKDSPTSDFRKIDISLPFWVLFLVLYQIGLDIDGDLNSTLNNVLELRTLYLIFSALIAAASSLAMLWIARWYVLRSTYPMTTNNNASTVRALAAFGITLTAQLLSAHLFDGIEQFGDFAIPFIGITSAIAGVGVFYHGRTIGLKWCANVKLGTRIELKDIEPLLALKRVIFQGVFTVMGLFLLGVMLNYEKIALNTAEVSSFWILIGIMAIVAGGYKFVLLRMMDEYETVRVEKVDDMLAQQEYEQHKKAHDITT